MQSFEDKDVFQVLTKVQLCNGQKIKPGENLTDAEESGMQIPPVS